MKVEIRPMQVADIPEVVAIEERWPYLSKWGVDGYRIVLGDPRIYTCLVAVDQEPAASPGRSLITGFAVLALLVDRCELCNIVVLPEYISRDVGQKLLDQCIEIARPLDTDLIFLEVRQSNARAIHFYERNGFRITAQRKSYYRSPTEHAWIMERKL